MNQRSTDDPPGAEWFADYPRHHGLKPDETGGDEAAFIQTVLQLQPDNSVLDAPCGAGRISVCLARAGLRVTGVDLTAAYVERAKNRFQQQGLEGDFLVLDLRRLDFERRFDAAFNWQGSFGFFSECDNEDVVLRYARSLKRGGRLLIDQPGRDYMLRHFRPRGCNGDIESVTRWDARQQRVSTTFRNRVTAESWAMTIRFYSPAQFRKLFRNAGLEVEAMYCDLAGRAYYPGARRLYVVGRKVD